MILAHAVVIRNLNNVTVSWLNKRIYCATFCADSVLRVDQTGDNKSLLSPVFNCAAELIFLRLYFIVPSHT